MGVVGKTLNYLAMRFGLCVVVRVYARMRAVCVWVRARTRAKPPR
jgi:hypothetical protein